MDKIDEPAKPDLQSQLDEHHAIRQQLRITWNVFFAKFGRLRDVQLKVIPAIISGADVLVTAPTAGGKTEAVMAPVCELIKSNGIQGLSCLYITPTRALVNDLFARLETQLTQLGLRLGRQTADHSQRKDSNVLITTPESLESMLTFKKQLLGSVRIVVMDEIHLLDGTARGDQLRLLLRRLKRYLTSVNVEQKLTRIAISATVSDPKRIADIYLDGNARIVSVVGQRPIECKYISPQEGQAVVDCIVQGINSFADVFKVLVFANRRRDVDEFADLFRERCSKQIEVFGHHGSLGREQRESVETSFRNAKCALCVATMTLEIGIDIGDVDLVVCIDPPNNLSSFLQRIGRGCRRRQSATRVLCFSSDPVSEVVFRAYEFGAKNGLPRSPLPPLRRSVLLQQVLAYLQQTDRRRRTENQLLNVFCDHGRPEVGLAMVRDVVADMVDTGLLVFEEGIYRIGKHGADFISSPKIYSNLAPKTEIAVVDADSGKTIAYIGSTNSDNIKIAGKRYEIADQPTGGIISVRATDAKGAVSPGYVAMGHLGFSSEVGSCIAKYLSISDSEIVFTEGYVFTWLGNLHNTLLSNCLRSTGISTSPFSFCIKIGNPIEPASLLACLKRAAALLANGNCIGSLAVESLADCGAHHRALSEAVRDRSRSDWLDSHFILSWKARIESCRHISTTDILFKHLELLSQI